VISIKEHHLGTHRQRPRNRHPLLLSTRELVWVGPHLRAETNPFQQTLREILDFGRRSLVRERRTKTDVLHGGHVRKEIELLEHDPHLLPQRSYSRPRHPGSDPADPCPVPEGIPVQPDLSGVVLLEEVDAPEKGGLP
jgi:hypothetical protein